MRAATIIGASLFVCLGIYAIPNLMELTLLNSMNPWITCVLLGDLLGCGILFLLGFRRIALAIYVLSSVIEGTALLTHWVRPQHLVWLTNLAPTIAVGAILMSAGLRTLVNEE